MAINFQRLEEITRALKPTGQTGRSFHTTFVYFGNKMVCVAHNDYNKIHRYHKFGEYQACKTDKKTESKYVSGIHSECAAIIKLGLTNCRHLTFVNIRINNNGTPAMSKPCPNCQRIINSVGFRNFWYYDGNKYLKIKY